MKLSTGACAGGCPVFEFSVDSLNNVKYTAIQNNQQAKGYYSGKLSTHEFEKLMEMAEEANFPAMEDDYYSKKPNLGNYALTVHFSNGYKKRIDDYGRSGPDELSNIYDHIFFLRTEHNWRFDSLLTNTQEE